MISVRIIIIWGRWSRMMKRGCDGKRKIRTEKRSAAPLSLIQLINRNGILFSSFGRAGGRKGVESQRANPFWVRQENRSELLSKIIIFHIIIIVIQEITIHIVRDWCKLLRPKSRCELSGILLSSIPDSESYEIQESCRKRSPRNFKFMEGTADSTRGLSIWPFHPLS